MRVLTATGLLRVVRTRRVRAIENRRLWGFLRHGCLSEERAVQFWDRIAELVREFGELPRSGDTVHGFAVGSYRPATTAGDGMFGTQSIPWVPTYRQVG